MEELEEFEVVTCTKIWSKVKVLAINKKHAEFRTNEGDYDTFIESIIDDEIYYSVTSVKK